MFQPIIGEDPPNSRMWFMSGQVILDKMNKTSAGFHCGAKLELIRPEPYSMSNNVSNTESVELAVLTAVPKYNLVTANIKSICLHTSQQVVQ